MWDDDATITTACANYLADGFVCIRGGISQEWVDLLERGLTEVMKSPGPFRIVEHDESKAICYLSDLFSWTRNPLLRKFIFESPAGMFAGRIMKSRRINFFYDHSFLRNSSAATRTRWHNDKAYWPVTGEQLCTIWIPTEAVTKENGPLECVAGSHLWGQAFKDHLFPVYHEPQYKRFDTTHVVWNPAPDIEGYRESFSVRTIEMERGDCLVLHPLVLHGSPPIANGQRRWAYATRWAGDDVRYRPRIDTQRLAYDPGLEPGDPLAGDLFPMVWSGDVI